MAIRRRKKTTQHTPGPRINNAIHAQEMRVIIDGEGTLGVLSLREALAAAQERNLDLIEISPGATPPVAKIMDYGKFQYEQKKKRKEIKAKAHTVEVKSIQIKIGTGEGDLKLKADRASKWLKEKNRVKVELYLRGRAKYLDKKFHMERLERVLELIEEPYENPDGVKKSPKGIHVIISPSKKKKVDKKAQPKAKEATPAEKPAQ